MHVDKKLPRGAGAALKGDVRQNWITIANLAQSPSEQSTANLLLSGFTAYGQPFLLHRNKGELHVIFIFLCTLKILKKK